MARLPALVSMSVVARLSALSLLSLIWLSTATAMAQYRFDSWTTDNGLPQNSVRSILQTRDGYLWQRLSTGLCVLTACDSRSSIKVIPGDSAPTDSLPF